MGAPKGLFSNTFFPSRITLITWKVAPAHLHAQIVLAGDANPAEVVQISVNGVFIGRRNARVMLGVQAMNIAFAAISYPKLQMTSFDRQSAAVACLRPRLLHTV